MQYQVDLKDLSQENGQKPIFWHFGSFKNTFRHFWMILHDLVTLQKVRKHLVLSQYAISSRSNRPNSRKWPKTSFLGFWIIQKCIFVIFEWSSMSDIIAKLLETFCIIWICKMKSIWLAKPNKLTQNWQDHSKITYLFYGK